MTLNLYFLLLLSDIGSGERKLASLLGCESKVHACSWVIFRLLTSMRPGHGRSEQKRDSPVVGRRSPCSAWSYPFSWWVIGRSGDPGAGLGSRSPQRYQCVFVHFFRVSTADVSTSCCLLELPVCLPSSPGFFICYF